MNNLDSFVKEFNKNYIQKELTENEILFDNIDEKKLDIQQREAVIVDEDNNLVLAGAGSGKTLTIVAKVKYLIERKKIKPEEILLISFTKKTTEELTERLNKLGINLTAKTFHKLGLDIIVNNQGNRPDISESLSPVIDNYFNQNISKDNEKINKLLHYFAYYLNIPKSLDEFDNLGECYDFFRNTDFETFKGKVELQKEMQQKKIKKETFRGEIVKSLEELLIANFLYLNGIDYIYEYKYPFISEDKYKKQYKPDFYLTEYDIYLEHFGVNENNQAPWLSKIEEKKYLESIIWKRNFHKKNGTKLLETYSYYNKNRMLTEKLKEILIRNNIKLNPIDAKDVFNDIFNNKNNQFKEFKKLIATFINLFKANNYSVNNFKILEDKTSKFQDSYLKTRTFLFLDFIKPILLDYEESLKINNSIDFNDMINKATAIIKDEKLLMPYKYILVDEFQDISFSRYSLLKEIKNTTSAKIVCVGDDWQSIYRFRFWCKNKINMI